MWAYSCLGPVKHVPRGGERRDAGGASGCKVFGGGGGFGFYILDLLLIPKNFEGGKEFRSYLGLKFLDKVAKKKVQKGIFS